MTNHDRAHFNFFIQIHFVKPHERSNLFSHSLKEVDILHEAIP